MKRVIISGFWALSLATDQIPGPFLSPTVLLRVIKKRGWNLHDKCWIL